MSEQPTHVVIAENGIDHNGLHYPKGAKVHLDKRSAAYHSRNFTVSTIEAADVKPGRKTREDAA